MKRYAQLLWSINSHSHLEACFLTNNLFYNLLCNSQMAKKNKEKYALEMEAYKQKKDEEAAHFMKEEEEHMKLQKQEALQLLKKKEKTENIIKVFSSVSI